MFPQNCPPAHPSARLHSTDDPRIFRPGLRRQYPYHKQRSWSPQYMCNSPFNGLAPEQPAAPASAGGMWCSDPQWDIRAMSGYLNCFLIKIELSFHWSYWHCFFCWVAGNIRCCRSRVHSWLVKTMVPRNARFLAARKESRPCTAGESVFCELGASFLAKSKWVWPQWYNCKIILWYGLSKKTSYACV